MKERSARTALALLVTLLALFACSSASQPADAGEDDAGPDVSAETGDDGAGCFPTNNACPANKALCCSSACYCIASSCYCT